MMAERTTTAAEDIIRMSFRLARSDRLDDLMSLFQHGAMVYESPSSAGALSDMQGIESFLKIARVDKGHMSAMSRAERSRPPSAVMAPADIISHTDLRINREHSMIDNRFKLGRVEPVAALACIGIGPRGLVCVYLHKPF